MGITYKAVDVDLHCPVTLKVISEKYLGDEAARVRFFREARAAASVRHPNVASVFHLGRKGRDYFYAMEFVEGETLDSLIKRSGRLEVKLALEITRQVASGLAAVHKKSLVHRDIKPSNIMVSLEEEGSVTAKIIDLGLAKIDDESGAQTTISASGAFAGTPEFRQSRTNCRRRGGHPFGSLLTGCFALADADGSGAIWRSCRCSHGSASARWRCRWKNSKAFRRRWSASSKCLLDKDPARRFQTPAELLKALPAVIGAVEEGSTITYQGSGQMRDKEPFFHSKEAASRWDRRRFP